MLISSEPEPLNGELNSIFKAIRSLVTEILENGHVDASNPEASGRDVSGLDPSGLDPSGPITRTLDIKGLKAIESLSTPGEPMNAVSVMREAVSIFDYRMRLDHPRCFAYIPSFPSPLAYIGDFLTSIFNVNVAMWNISGGPSAIEASLIRWLATQVGMPSSAGGCFVSGASMANLSGAIAARDRMLLHEQRSDAVIYISEQTHVSVAKSLHIIGFSSDQIRVISTDSTFSMDCEALQQAIDIDRQLGKLPFLIIASCGSTNTGSIDPLHKLADMARDQKMWLHVDGAYGASIALSSKHRNVVDGLGRADSLSWDGHKWLFQTYGCGIVLVRDREALNNSFTVDADYIRTSCAPDGSTNFYNLTPELSRPSRAMSLWFTLRVLGHRRIGEMIDQGFTLASTAEREVRILPDWEIISPAVASIVVFRYAPSTLNGAMTDSLNALISAKLLAENIAAILTTKLHGRTVLRFCAINPSVHPNTVSEIIQSMGKLAREELAHLMEKTRQPGPDSLCAVHCSSVRVEQPGVSFRR